MLKVLRHDAKRTKSKLLAEDRPDATSGNIASERIILCHVLMRTNCPHQPPGNDEDKENNPENISESGIATRRGRPHSQRVSRSI